MTSLDDLHTKLWKDTFKYHFVTVNCDIYYNLQPEVHEDNISTLAIITSTYFKVRKLSLVLRNGRKLLFLIQWTVIFIISDSLN